MKKLLFAPLLLIAALLVSFAFQKANRTTGTSNPSAAAQKKYKTENVILLVVDGPRYSETWGDPTHQYIPHMAGDLAKEGVICTSFFNNGFTYTNSGHTALTTSLRQPINNIGERDYPLRPSILQYYLKSTGKPKTAAWVITTKDKLEILGNTVDPKWKDKYLPSTDCGINGIGTGYREDSVTFNHIKRTLKEYHPNLVVINFKEPDASGHANNWQGYLQGIRDTDRYVWEIWNFIQNDPNYKDKTTLFVTNDHGRHLDGVKDGFVNHGDDCEGCRHINLFVVGPDIKKNVFIDQPHYQVDVPVTIGELLGFKMEKAEGKVLKDLLRD